MHKLISTILVLFPLWLFCQSSPWLEMDADCQDADYFVQYVSDNNHMIIGIPSVGESYVTTDGGQSFQRFPWTSGRFLVEIQKEGDSNDFYFTDGKLIYRYDQISESASVVHNNSEFGFIQKGLVLKNGERLVIYYESGELILGRFDNNGALIVSTVLSDKLLKVELLYQEGFPTYITKSTYGQVVKTMLPVDPIDLSLGNEFVIDAHSTGMRYLNGRLFSSNEYSDDGGLTWSKINSQVNVGWGTSIDILDDQIIVLARKHILHSIDAGASFTVKSHSLETASMNISFDNDGTRLILYNSSNLNNVLFSDDLGSTWSEYDNSLALSNATRLAALEDDQLMANTINCNGRYRSDGEWNDVNISDESYIWDFAGVPNGNYVGVSAGKIYLSEDLGANWEVIEPEFYEARLTIKEGVVYVTGYSGVAISEDSGENYVIYNGDDVPMLYSSSHFSDLSTVYYDSNGELSTYDFISEDKVSLARTLDQTTHISLETDWNGKGFYILEYETADQDQLVIYRSASPGSSFVKKIIPIALVGSDYRMETDHNGNVVIYNEDQIIISQDQGDSWYDITPDRDDLWLISDVSVSYDNYLYISTVGAGILKLSCKVDSDIMDCAQLVANDSGDISLQVYPNPFIDHVNLVMEESANYEVTIYDLKGIRIRTDKNMDRIELEALLPGVYLVELTDLDSSRKAFKKIVK